MRDWKLPQLSCSAKVRHKQAYEPESRHPDRLKLLSFNMQVAINTRAFHHYITRSWRHVLPHREHQLQLNTIGQLLSEYDLVALQETDAGSFRSRFTNQVEYLAEMGQFPYWYQQLNRNYGRLAQHGNGILSRYSPCIMEDHRLPGRLPGRGAIAIQLGSGDDALMVVVLHLSLGPGSRRKQLEYVRELIGEHKTLVIMGDFNCHHDQILLNGPLKDLRLHHPEEGLHTYPSWQPDKALDHILVSEDIQVLSASVLNHTLSDHLPIAMEIQLPEPINLAK